MAVTTLSLQDKGLTSDGGGSVISKENDAVESAMDAVMEAVGAVPESPLGTFFGLSQFCLAPSPLL